MIYIKKTLRKYFRILVPVLLFYITTGCAGPTIPPPFGTNKVITQQSKWYVAQTPHFEIYYYSETEKLIPRISQILEDAYQRVTKDLDYEPLEKTPFFIYATHNDFEQTNITDIVGEGVGGFAEALKNRFVIPLTGSERELEYVIRHEYTHIVTFEIFYGGFWKSVRLLKSVFYPYWFMEGIAEYETGVWDSRADMLVRDAAISNKLIPLDDLLNFAHLESSQILLAYSQSHAFMQYIADNYGKDKIAVLPFEFKDRFDSSGVLRYITKKDIFRINEEWQNFLKQKYSKDVENKKEPDFYGKQLTKNRKNNTNPVFSPDGEKIAFISNRNNYFDIFLMNSDGSQLRSLLKNKIMRNIDVITTKGHALSWSPDGEKIVFAAEKNQRDYLYIFNLKNKKLKKLKNKLDSVSSPYFSSDGKQIVFVGMKDGINDLYLVDINGNNLEQLTDDYFDDDYPIFYPDGKKILYVSERNKQLDLFEIDVETVQIRQITNTPFDELSASYYNNGDKIIFVSDASGIYNIYSMNNDGTEVIQLTDVKIGNFTPNYSIDNQRLLFVSYRFGEMNIYLSRQGKLAGEQKLIIDEPQTSKLSSQTNSAENIIISTPLDTESNLKISSSTLKSIEINNKELNASTTGQITVSLDRIPEASPQVGYPLSEGSPYYFKGSTDLFYPFLIYSTSEGLYLALYWQGSELLGNHQIWTFTEYSSGNDWLDFNIFYTFKKWRPHFSLGTQVKKESYYDENDNFIKSDKWGKYLYINYPFDRFNRIVVGLHSYDVTKKNRDLNDLITKDRENGVSLSLVRDLTSGEMFDLTRGRRTNFTFYQAKKVLGGDFDYTDYLIDAQNYTTLVKNHIFALRIFGNFSEGPDKETFPVGGSDRVRGYPRSEYNNNKLVAVNTEYRFLIFPKINYHMWYIIPDFYFKSLQGIIFVDTGLGWDSRGEFKAKDINSLKTSVGIGLRLNTFILEAFPLILRLDYAKRTDISDEGVLYFTSGFSF